MPAIGASDTGEAMGQNPASLEAPNAPSGAVVHQSDGSAAMQCDGRPPRFPGWSSPDIAEDALFHLARAHGGAFVLFPVLFGQLHRNVVEQKVIDVGKREVGRLPSIERIALVPGRSSFP